MHIRDGPARQPLNMTRICHTGGCGWTARQGRPIPATRDVRLRMARPGGTQLGISMDRWMSYAHVT
jgi:hypothetical protein